MNINNWLKPAFTMFASYLEQQRLPHALILTGQRGIGKSVLAKKIVQSVLCRSRDSAGEPCGQCESCHQLAVGTHPDFIEIMPEEEGKEIRVDQIRKMCVDMSLTSHSGGFKVTHIHPADAMNANAANSLLKTLEEPTDSTFVLLETADTAQLPITIRSRCQQLVCAVPDKEQSIAWLSMQLPDELRLESLLIMANGAPCLALRLHQDGLFDTWSLFIKQLADVAERRLSPLKVANSWSKMQVIQMLGGLQAILRYMVVARQTDTSRDLKEKDFDRLLGLSESIDVRTLHLFLEKCNKALFLLTKKSGLNQDLLIEDVLINWEKLFTTSKRHSA